MIPFGLQLYTVRDYMAKDSQGTLNRVKAMGYDNVELFGVGPAEAADCKKMLDAAKLKAVSAHIGFDDVIKNTAGVIEAARTLGMKYICVPFLKLETIEQWVEAAKAMDAAGARLRQDGLRLGYHNHAHEFERIGDDVPFEIIFNTAKPENLAVELDVFWVKLARLDPVVYINRFKERCPLLHIKDMAVEGQRDFAPVGQGVIDWQPILEAAAKVNVDWYLVEQDQCAGDSLECAATSAKFMAQC